MIDTELQRLVNYSDVLGVQGRKVLQDGDQEVSKQGWPNAMSSSKRAGL